MDCGICAKDDTFKGYLSSSWESGEVPKESFVFVICLTFLVIGLKKTETLD